MRLPSQRHLFDIPENVAYLNCAYMSPLMTKVRDAVVRGLDRKLHPWRIAARDFYEGSDQLRAAFAELIHARADDVAIVASASYGVSTAAANLPLGRGEGILVVEEQFPSNVYPWRELARSREASVVSLRRPADFDWTRAVLEAIDDGKNRISIVALPQCHWTDGGLFDLAAIGAACRERGKYLCLDVTQSAGAFPLDVRRIQPDFLTAATYKWLMGTYSLGLLYVSERWQREGRPIEHNWIHRRDSENFARLVDYQDEFDAGARRFDVGERSNFALVPGATAAIRQILEWGVENVSETIGRMTEAIGDRARALGLRFAPRERRAPHFIGLGFSGRAGELPANLLEALARRGVYVSVRGASVRVTPHVYNDERDLERFLGALEEVLS
jgi:selenocysteine lyase/cysteine desulfurase